MTAFEKLLPIVMLLVTVGVMVARLPKVDMPHSDAYRRRRVMNWVPLGLTYAFLYFGRYNLSAIADILDREGLLTKAQFGDIDGVGAYVYGFAFLINGPLADRWGGRTTILLAAVGSALCNLGMAWSMQRSMDGGSPEGLREQLIVLNAANMYVQSFGAVSIVKVNAPWFHVRERGVLGGLFGILISLGLYFSYDWSLMLAKEVNLVAPFWVPAAVLAVAAVVCALVVKNQPSDAGFPDFNTGDASSDQVGTLGLGEVARRMFSQRVIWLIVGIEFCSGFMRQAVMKWYRPYARAIGEQDGFVYQNWGMLLCIAGILGGVFAGFISDHVFQSRRGPVASVLYGGLFAGSLVALFTVGGPALAWSVVGMSLCVIGVHGMLSGTASMDFGGSKNAGVVTGVIDGFVYLGGGTQALLFGRYLPVGDAAAVAAEWQIWPTLMLPVAFLGLVLCTRIWHAKPKSKAAH